MPDTTQSNTLSGREPVGVIPARDRRGLARACRIGFFVLLAVIAASQSWAFLFKLKFDPANPQFNSGWKPDFCDFWLAGKTLLEGENFYDVGRRWYVYPPMLAVMFSGLAKLPVTQAGAIWACLNTALFGLGVWMGVKEMGRRFAVPTWVPRWSAVVPAAALLVAVLMFDKGNAVVRLGQTDAMIVLACVLSLRWMGRKPVWSGLALAFAANIKYQSLVFIPYLIIRGRWKEAISASVGTVAIAMSTSLIFGWERNLEYVTRAVSSLARLMGTKPPADAGLQPIHPLTWERSVSFPSVLARMVEQHQWPQSVVLLGVAGLALVVFAATWMLYRWFGLGLFVGRGGRGDDFTAQRRALVGIEWVGLMVALCVFSPQTSARHMYLVLIPMCASAIVILAGPNGRGRWVALAGAVILMLGLILPPGGASWDAAVKQWRWGGGASWCLLAMWFALVWSGLRWIGGGRGRGRHPLAGEGDLGGRLADREPIWTPRAVDSVQSEPRGRE